MELWSVWRGQDRWYDRAVGRTGSRDLPFPGQVPALVRALGRGAAGGTRRTRRPGPREGDITILGGSVGIPGQPAAAQQVPRQHY